MRRLLLLAIALVASAFSGSAAQAAMQYPTPLIYFRWWNDVQECVGATRNINEVHFNVVEIPSWEQALRYGDSTRVVRVDGLYVDNAAKIYIGLGGEGVKGLVRHEMAHAILHHSRNEHPDSIFKGHCAPLFEHKQSNDSGD